MYTLEYVYLIEEKYIYVEIKKNFRHASMYNKMQYYTTNLPSCKI